MKEMLHICANNKYMHANRINLTRGLCVVGYVVLNEHDGNPIAFTNTLLKFQTIVIIAYSCSCSPVGALKFK